MRLFAFVLAGCHAAQSPHPEPSDPPGVLRLAEGTNHAFGACFVGTSNLWDRLPDGGSAKRPSGTLSIAEADGGEHRIFAFAGDDIDLCGARYHVQGVEAGHTPGAVLLVESKKPGGEEPAAIALARSCFERDAGDRTVWGSPPVYAGARATLLHDRTYLVEIPETGQHGKPQGISYQVNLATGFCETLALE